MAQGSDAAVLPPHEKTFLCKPCGQTKTHADAYIQTFARLNDKDTDFTADQRHVRQGPDLIVKEGDQLICLACKKLSSRLSRVLAAAGKKDDWDVMGSELKKEVMAAASNASGEDLKN